MEKDELGRGRGEERRGVCTLVESGDDVVEHVALEENVQARHHDGILKRKLELQRVIAAKKLSSTTTSPWPKLSTPAEETPQVSNQE